MNKDIKISSKKLMDQLKKVLDPELGISIVDLGLIYDIKIKKKGEVKVVMTLTSMGCPLYEMIEQSVKNELQKVPFVKDVWIELTFKPVWTPDRMSKEARNKLGFL